MRLVPNNSENPKFDANLEGLRGWASLIVLFIHLFNVSFALDPAYELPKWLAYCFPAHTAVLIFFLLSGYVIGITNTKKTQFKPNEYLAKRAIRIYPIYFIAILISLVPLKEVFWPQVIGNLFFLQNYSDYFGLHIPPLGSNGPLWSLNYEVLYYLLFILIVKYPPKISWLITSIILIIWCKLIASSFPLFLSFYGTGALYWFTGLWLAWNMQKIDRGGINTKKILELIFVFCSVHAILPIDVVLSYVKFSSLQNGVGSNASDFFTYPIHLYFFMLFLKKETPIILKWYLLLFKILIIAIVGYLFYDNRLFEDTRWWMGAIFITLSLVPINPNWLIKIRPIFIWLGGVSYAMYLIHYPIIIIIKELPFLPSGSLFAFLFRLLILLASVIGLSYLMEKKLQPLLKRYLLHRHN